MTKIKVCGIRRLDELEKIVDLDIDYFGCIFHKKSPRCVDVNLATEITKLAHENGKKTVGVVVNERIKDIIELLKKTKIDVIQLHGQENLKFVEQLYNELRKNNLDVKIWKVFQIFDKIPKIEKYFDFIEYPLFDAKGKQQGGNGIVFDWDLLTSLGYKYVLAGGLSSENIEKALYYDPTVVDINSKVEVNKRKNRELIIEIIEKIRKEG